MIAATEDIKTDRRRVRTRAALLQAGQSLFAAQSVDAVSIDDIVAAADVAKGSFYNHFPDKDALAREIAVTVRAEAEAQVDLANAGVTEPASRMARGQAVFVRYAVRNPERARAMMRLHAGATLPNAPMNRGLRADIEAGLADGSFRDLTVETGLLMAMGMGMVAVTRVLEVNDSTDPTALSRDLNFGLLRGLGVAEDAARAISAAAVADIFKET
ncbi:MAG: TetR/AcrR family transcriptional regulator [Caulobacterales bacterium]|nr:TetR/AcrR family transcriptional regulator [Caulobacterales bacterium]